MSMHSFPERVPQPRNMAIFWGATLEGRSQGELAAEHGVSQQRVSQIVRSVRLFLALATSEQYEGVPQGAQLQFGCRVQLEKLARRRRSVAQAWDASTRPFTSVKRVQTAQGERTETVEKSRYGDWRLDRQLGEIDKQMLDTTVLLYERPWVGKEELRSSDCGLGIGGQGMRKAELGRRNGGAVEAVAEVEPACLQSAIRNPQSAIEPAEDSLPNTAELEPIAPADVDEPACPESPFRIPDSEFRIPSSQSAIEPARPFPAPNPAFRPEPLCDLTGQWIKPPSDAHRPWRRVLLPREWLLANPTASGTTPEGVLWKLAPPLTQVGIVDSGEACGSREADLAWDELGCAEQDALESSELLVGV